MSLQNTWHHRRVANTAAKACFICYKPSTSVLITPDNKDFFYICPAHLKDRNFCSPVVDTAGQEAKRQESMEAEIEKVKKEYEEKRQKKQEKKKEKEKDSEKSKEEDEKNKDADKTKDGTKENAKSDEKERDEKIESLQKQGQGAASSSDDSPRIFSLHKNFYQMRIDRLRGIEVAKRNRQRMQDPSIFPSVPSGGVN